MCPAAFRSSLFALLLAAPLPAARAATWFVAPDGSGDRPTIQAAVDAASNGDEILLQDGVFAGPGNRDVDFAGRAITIRSLHGVASACVIDCGGTPGEPHRAFLFHSGEAAGSVLERIRIQNGLAWDEGGAVRCVGASPRLLQLELAGNQAGFGGGLACLDGAAPSIEGALFTANRADFGSAAACRNASPRFTDCTFAANEIAEIGGGLLCEQGSHPTLERCLFAGNRAEIGGALACRDGSDPRLSDCRFLGNAADAGGGEGGAAWCANSSPTFTACIFAGNTATGHGGALACAFASPLLVRSTLYGNRAPLGGGVYSWLDSNPAIVATIIAASGAGEAVACESGGTALLTCSDLHANAGGDWVGPIAAQLGTGSNFSSDPRFCDAGAGDLHLHADSPCLPPSSPGTGGCGLVGALGPACPAAPSADLALRKVADRPAVALGENVTFTITLVNLGPDTATEITFGDPVPDPLNFVAWSCAGGTATGGSYCQVDELAPGDSVTATLVATPIPNPAPSERWCQNTAYIAACATPDPDPTNDTASALVRLTEPPTGVEPGDSRRLALWPASSSERGVARFGFWLPADEPQVDLAVFDVRGREVAVLGRGAFTAGLHAADWTHAAASIPSGMYFARLQTSSGRAILKVLVAR